jgi:hypothetical protein
VAGGTEVELPVAVPAGPAITLRVRGVDGRGSISGWRTGTC